MKNEDLMLCSTSITVNIKLQLTTFLSHAILKQLKASKKRPQYTTGMKPLTYI